MIKFEEYKDKYQCIRLERQDGILLMTFHLDGGVFKSSSKSRDELYDAFGKIASDFDNKVVIWTGTGDDFWADSVRGMPHSFESPQHWEYNSMWEGIKLLENLLDIQAPMICAVNGPALIHAQLPVLCDIVLAAEHAAFQDSTHFPLGNVPGDGVQIVWPMLLGTNRGRYFLLTGQKLTAQQALDLGVVSEVLPKEKLLPRAWELAEELVKRPALTLRYTRILFTRPIKQQMHDLLGYGMALEGLNFVDKGMHG